MTPHARLQGRFALPPLLQFGPRVRSATTTIIAIAVVAVSIVVAAWINREAQKAASEVSHSIEIRERSERFLGHVRDAETGQRGFLLTLDEAYLAPYQNGRARAYPELEALEDLVADDPRQKARTVELRAATAAKLAELDATIELARGGRASQAVAALRAGAGGSAMTTLRSIDPADSARREPPARRTQPQRGTPPPAGERRHRRRAGRAGFRGLAAAADAAEAQPPAGGEQYRARAPRRRADGAAGE